MQLKNFKNATIETNPLLTKHIVIMWQPFVSTRSLVMNVFVLVSNLQHRLFAIYLRMSVKLSSRCLG